MNKFHFYPIIVALLFVLVGVQPQAVFGFERKIAGDSGLLIATLPKAQPKDYRIEKLRAFLLANHSPLTPYANEFVIAADKYNLDYRLVVAISGVESTFGKAIPKNSYNAYGWNNGAYAFHSWSESIQVVSQTLRENYIDKWHAQTVPEIGRIYAPPSKTWSSKVLYFMDKIEQSQAKEAQVVLTI